MHEILKTLRLFLGLRDENQYKFSVMETPPKLIFANPTTHNLTTKLNLHFKIDYNFVSFHFKTHNSTQRGSECNIFQKFCILNS